MLFVEKKFKILKAFQKSSNFLVKVLSQKLNIGLIKYIHVALNLKFVHLNLFWLCFMCGWFFFHKRCEKNNFYLFGFLYFSTYTTLKTIMYVTGARAFASGKSSHYELPLHLNCPLKHNKDCSLLIMSLLANLMTPRLEI